MELTESWRANLPSAVTGRYRIAETRNASAILRATAREQFEEMVHILSTFELTVDKLATPGGSKSVIAKELDESFRVRGWREARFDQELVTTLTFFPWLDGGESGERSIEYAPNRYGGHKIDNVKGRAALDVEWNPKDGNLDRDIMNYVNLYSGGVIDAGVIVTRAADGLREFVRELIRTVKSVDVGFNPIWSERMGKLAADPLGTSTTANFDKLLPRLERGDGQGCPMLAFGITKLCFVPPVDSIEDEVRRLAAAVAETGAGPTETVEESLDEG